MKGAFKVLGFYVNQSEHGSLGIQVDMYVRQLTITIYDIYSNVFIFSTSVLKYIEFQLIFQSFFMVASSFLVGSVRL